VAPGRSSTFIVTGAITDPPVWGVQAVSASAAAASATTARREILFMRSAWHRPPHAVDHRAEWFDASVPAEICLDRDGRLSGMRRGEETAGAGDDCRADAFGRGIPQAVRIRRRRLLVVGPLDDQD